jgi:hypothetical protein
MRAYGHGKAMKRALYQPAPHTHFSARSHSHPHTHTHTHTQTHSQAHAERFALLCIVFSFLPPVPTLIMQAAAYLAVAFIFDALDDNLVSAHYRNPHAHAYVDEHRGKRAHKGRFQKTFHKDALSVDQVRVELWADYLLLSRAVRESRRWFKRESRAHPEVRNEKQRKKNNKNKQTG